MKKNFLFPSFTAALDAVIEDVSRRKTDLKRRHIIIVPDRCTLTAERALCKKTGGAFDAYVTTWSRLTGTTEGEYLPKKGSVMLVRKILADVRNRLKCYSRSWATKGFASRMYGVISQLSVCGITPEEIITDDGGKSEDIALVYSEYLNATEGELTDASGRMIALARTVENTDLVSGAVVYIACFDMYTALMQRVISAIESKADELRIYDTDASSSERGFGDVELYSSPSTASAAKAIAARIAAARKAGTPYDDMCVVTAAPRPYELVRIFRENGIPYCASEGLTLAEHRLGAFLSDAIGAIRRGYRAEDILRLAKNPLSGVDKRDCDALERFVVRRGITYKLFLSPFAKEGAAAEYYDGAESARAVLAGLLGEIDAAGDAGTRLERMIDYAEAHYPPELAEADEGRASPAAKARELVSLCSRLLEGVPDDIAVDAFCEGMRETELSARPRLRGAVEIGSERDFRARRFSHVFVADFDSDAHPAVTTDDGLISDREIAALRERGAMLSPTTAEVNRRSADEFYLLLGGAEKIMLVYSEKAGNVLDVIRRGARSFTENSWAKETAKLGMSEDPADLFVYCPTENMLAERYLAALSEAEENGDEPYWLNYARALCPDAEKLRLSEPSDTSAAAGGLMMGNTTSVTQLENYFKCPRRHYFDYALKLKKPEEARLNALDIGNILHGVAERYVSEAFDEDACLAADRLLAEEIAKTGKSEDDNRRITRLLRAEAEGLCRGIRSQIEAGAFRPVGTEEIIGDGGKYAALELDAGGKKVRLRGKIDRIDLCGDLVRLIDYKTGGVSCSLGEVHTGVKLQLLLYLAVMRKCGYRPAGSFYLPTRTDFTTELPYGLVGFCDNGDEVLNAMDPCILKEKKSDVIAVKYPNRKRPVICSGESGEQLGMLMDYAVSAASGAAAEIADGYIAPSPHADSRSSECAYCDYRDCCPGGVERRETAPCLPDPRKGE